MIDILWDEKITIKNGKIIRKKAGKWKNLVRELWNIDG